MRAERMESEHEYTSAHTPTYPMHALYKVRNEEKLKEKQEKKK